MKRMRQLVDVWGAMLALLFAVVVIISSHHHEVHAAAGEALAIQATLDAGDGEEQTDLDDLAKNASDATCLMCAMSGYPFIAAEPSLAISMWFGVGVRPDHELPREARSPGSPQEPPITAAT